MSYYPPQPDPNQPGQYPPQQPRQSFPSGQWGQPLPPNAQPTQAWNAQQPPTYPPPPPPMQPGFGMQPGKLPPRKRHTWRNLGIGCGVLLIALIGCMVFAATTSHGGTPQATIGSTATATSGSTLKVVVTIVPTKAKTMPTPTPVPTKAPTPTPTPLPPTPTPVPTQAPAPTQPPPAPTQSTGVNGNPWGYDFNPGNLIYNPNPGFCTYFDCVSTFWVDTSGYVVACVNGKYSHSGGISGACSRDGGVQSPLYSH